jgi:hypothetical protein
MPRRKRSAGIPGLTPDRQRTLNQLLETSLLGAAPYNHASQLARLHDMGITDANLRWLIAQGLAKHRALTTRPGQPRRAAAAAANLPFTSASCIALTPAGAALAKRLAAPIEPRLDHAHKRPKHHCPHYDADRRALLFQGQIVKQFKVPAENQELILLSFEEENWPPHLSDPLPGKKDMNTKRRLSDAIKNLNAHQVCPLIRFHGDGTGTGILWEKLPESFRRSSGDLP